MAFRWPTDPPGKAPAHTKSWDAHQAALKGTPAPAASPSPVNPLPLIQPPDSLYQDQTGLAGQALDTSLANVRQSRTGGLLEYGYNEDPTSGALTYDVNNAFSRAALLKKNYDTDRARSAQSMGSGGQLYSGAFQNQQDYLNRGQLQSQDALQKSLSAFLLGNTAAGTRAGTDYASAMQRAESARMARTLDNPLYSPDVTAADAAAVTPPTQDIGTAKRVSNKPLTLKAGPGVKSTRQTTSKTTRKGKTVTYSTSVKRP